MAQSWRAAVLYAIYHRSNAQAAQTDGITNMRFDFIGRTLNHSLHKSAFPSIWYRRESCFQETGFKLIGQEDLSTAVVSVKEFSFRWKWGEVETSLLWTIKSLEMILAPSPSLKSNPRYQCIPTYHSTSTKEKSSVFVHAVWHLSLKCPTIT